VQASRATAGEGEAVRGAALAVTVGVATRRSVARTNDGLKKKLAAARPQ
jgi:hypothetical protein